MQQLLKYQNELQKVTQQLSLLEQDIVVKKYLSLIEEDINISEIINLKLEKQVQYYIYLCELKKQLESFTEDYLLNYEQLLEQRALVLANKYLAGTTNPEVLKQLRNMLQRKDSKLNPKKQLNKEKYRRMYIKNQIKVMHHKIG